jgi:hypothetical protein
MLMSVVINYVNIQCSMVLGISNRITSSTSDLEFIFILRNVF